MFYYSLAEQLGYASVELMLDEMSSQEITEWQAYYKIKQSEQKKAETKARADARARRH